MAVETQDRWTEIRKIHVTWADSYRILGGVVLVGIGVLIGAALFANNKEADGYTTNLYTEFISIAVTVFILDFLNRQRDNWRRVEDLKARLLREVRSPENSVAKHAVHELREHGWLEGDEGLLRGANLGGANLAGAHLLHANLERAILLFTNLEGAILGGANLKKAVLWEAKLRGAGLSDANLQQADLADADLQGASLWEAKLREANLSGTNLQQADLLDADLQQARLVDTNLKGSDLYSANLEGANLSDAELQEAKLWKANLQGVKLEDTRFDEKTVLPDATWDAETRQFTSDSYWTPDTDMRKYTDPDHPDFWRPELGRVWWYPEDNGE